ncbi:GNAT family N-acetyltransferase [soil metagenome]
MPSARHATLADVEPLGPVLADAFASDPLWQCVVADQDRWERRAPAMFTHEVEGRLRTGHAYTTDDLAGVALWAPPGFWRPRLTELLRSLLPMVRLTGLAGGMRGLRFLGAMERAHPAADHWYLALLGTDPAHQGRGVGSALIKPVVDRCDQDGTGAYLESSDPANVAFYEGHGFRVTGEVTAGGSPPVHLMWRDPIVPAHA